MTARYKIRLAKEDFKFSVAHFTLFPDGTAEPLHGHNYRVRVEISGPRTDEHELLADVKTIKARIREACDALDESTLVPNKSALLELRREGDAFEIHLGDRHYRLPEAEVVLVPLANVSVEGLARMLWTEIAPALSNGAAASLAVEVEETPGQSAVYTSDL